MNEDAFALASESLALARAANLDVDAIRPMLPMAVAVAQLGDVELAAKIFGFVESRFAIHDMAKDPVELAVFKRLDAVLANGLDSADFERLRAEGAAMDVAAGREFARDVAHHSRASRG